MALENNYDQLINRYVEAIAGRDQDRIARTWLDINTTPGAEAYLRGNYPYITNAYILTGIATKLSQALAKYREEYPEELPLPFVGPASDGRPYYMLQDNRTIVLNSPNQDRMTIQEALESRINAPLLTNQEIVKLFPNKNRRSNQDLISSRLEQLYGP